MAGDGQCNAFVSVFRELLGGVSSFYCFVALLGDDARCSFVRLLVTDCELCSPDVTLWCVIMLLVWQVCSFLLLLVLVCFLDRLNPVYSNHHDSAAIRIVGGSAYR